MNYNGKNYLKCRDKKLFYSEYIVSDPSPPESKLEPVQRDNKNRMWILRETLYEDPDLIHFQDSPEDDPPTAEPPDTQPQTSHPPGYDWTKQQWQKASNFQGSVDKVTCKVPEVCTDNKFLKTVMVGLSQPVKLNKAESMMQRMGWQGGALGKTGIGIIEPIAPNITYATRTIGFGQDLYKKPSPIKKVVITKRLKNKELLQKRPNFNLNVLLHIFAFVRNDSEITMVFDKNLTDGERKVVHQWVNNVINDGDEVDGEVSSPEELEVVKLIHDHNNYLLSTKSEGQKPFRELTIFKEAPAHIYLVIPDDLKDEHTATDVTVTSESYDIVIDDDGNSTGGDEIDKGVNQSADNGAEMKYTDSNTDNMCIKEGQKAPHDILVEYFIEFSKESEYTEFRFLGLYDSIQLEALNEFWRNIYIYIDGDMNSVDKHYLPAFKNEEIYFTVDQDCNAYNVIYKHHKSSSQ
ncbi:uncharacterized protein LOC131855320 [Achroia grisella]|uniref:uncharacterized protein LOC131855320 n=1 Tax=Achroia grisella TaxID=688607 RepID=UPI0027D2535C|nr:uncharacterized protein LOC131855320 [Achroia grisella]